MKEKTRFASSPSLAMISQAIAKFYCGEEKELKKLPAQDIWEITQKDGRLISGVFVFKKRGRFYFSSTL